MAEETKTEEVVKEATEAAEPAEEEVTETAAETEAAAEAQPEKKKKLFSKKKDKKDEKIEELTDQLRRQMAEFDNYRKRTDKEKSAMYAVGAREIIEKMLPIVDSFERGLVTATEEQLEDPFVDGMNKVYKQMMKVFDEIGVEAIEAVGKEFNSDLHNAIMHVDDENVGDNIIVEEYQKGYTYKGNVVRYSMVKVAN